MSESPGGSAHTMSNWSMVRRSLAQPYRVTFFYPEGKGPWDWLVQPPLLVVLVGLLFALAVAPGLVDDLEQRAPQEDAAAG